MNPEHYNAVREAVIKAVPAILGGHVFMPGERDCKFCFEARFIRDRKRKVIAVEEGGGSLAEVTETIYDQRGFPCSSNPIRPIRLADVLLTVKESPKSIFIPKEAGDKGSPIRNLLEWLYENWNLRKDSLEDQSPETIEFLYKTLT